MKELKSVYSKINSVSKEVELSSEKIELGLVQDVQSLSKSYFKVASGFVESVRAIEKARQDMRDEFIKSEKAISELDKTYQQLSRNAKVLGLDVPKEAENAYKSALASMKNDLKTFKENNK